MAKSGKTSYSQFGEDLLIEGHLPDKKTLTYIDIGCLFPIEHSNTYRSYQSGGHGLCIDPNPDVAEAFGKERPRDTFFNTGVSSRDGTLEYSMFENPVFNTFDAARRDRVIAQSAKARRGRALIGSRPVPVKRLDSILDEVGWFEKVDQTDLLCMDVEGHELDVLQSFDMEKLSPRLIVCEMIGPMKNVFDNEITKYLTGYGYDIVCATGHDAMFKRT